MKALGTRREVTLGSVFALADRLDPKPKALPHLTDIKNGKLYADKWRDSLFFVKGWKGVIVLDPDTCVCRPVDQATPSSGKGSKAGGSKAGAAPRVRLRPGEARAQERQRF